MPDQHNVTDMGGTMRLGAYPCMLDEGSKAYKAYGKQLISERHRHRYEVNNDYRDLLEKTVCTYADSPPTSILLKW